MLEYAEEFVKQILNYGNFSRTEISNKAYEQLLMAVESVLNKGIITIPSLINMYKSTQGELIIDDTDNPKYGLAEIATKMKNLGTGGYYNGYKIVLFLWRREDKTIPFAFGLYHKESKSLSHIAMDGCSILRNQFRIKPKMVLADGAYGTNYLLKRLEAYGWGFVIKGKSTRTLDNVRFKKSIPRGYGTQIGRLSNGLKVKIVREQNRFFITNRVSLSREEVLAAYKRRWKIEEIFRFLKSCIGLNRCQQHSIRAQEVYLFGCFSVYSILERIRDTTIYKAFAQVMSGELCIGKRDLQEIFST